MTEPAPMAIDFRRDWSPSRLRSAMHCEQRYLYEYGLGGYGGWRTVDNDKTRFGRYLHAALAVFDSRRAMGATKLDAADAAIRAALQDTYGWVSADKRMNRRNLVRTVQWYCDDQPEDPADGLLAFVDNDGPMVERTVGVGLSRGRRLEVIFDVLGALGRVPVLVERKATTSDIGPNMKAHYSPDVQIDAQDIVARFQNGPLKNAVVVIEAHQDCHLG